ncbi:MAG TPA: HAD-IIIA family hydrolase [Gemmatimonadaceae bacterium]|nr:HAD-IIIA family hydrolase [Gemmatimonadaceae bacterium]
MDDRGGGRVAFVDRDDTIVVDRHYMNDPDQLELLPGAAAAIRLLAAEGIPSILCTNQSGIARGLITLAQYRAVHLRLLQLLANEGATLLDTFSCPHHPDFTGPCACRKPGTELYERAARLHGLDLARCLWIGDKHRDVAAAATFGGRALLVISPSTPEEDVAVSEREGVRLASSLLEGVRDILSSAR